MLLSILVGVGLEIKNLRTSTSAITFSYVGKRPTPVGVSYLGNRGRSQGLVTSGYVGQSSGVLLQYEFNFRSNTDETSLAEFE